MELGEIRGLLTALLFIAFIGIWIWSWSRKRKPEFDALANMPLEDASHPPADKESGEETR